MAKKTPEIQTGERTLSAIEAANSKQERSSAIAGKKQEFLIKLQEQNNALNSLKNTTEAKSALDLQKKLDEVAVIMDNSKNLMAVESQLSKLAAITSESSSLLEKSIDNSASVNSLNAISDTLKLQTSNIDLQTKTEGETSKTIQRLLKSTVAGDANVQKFQEEFLSGQSALKTAMETGDQVGIDLARAQLDAVEDAAGSEENRREAMAKQEEANSTLLKIADGVGGLGGKVAKTGGFLAGIAGLATLLFDPETFAKIVNKAVDIFTTITSLFRNLIEGDFETFKETASENLGLIAGLLGGSLLLVLPKVLRGVRAVKVAFVAFKTFMMSEFVAQMMSNLRGMMSSVGGMFMKAFTGLRTMFTVFRGFMLATFVPAMLGALSGMMAAITPILVAMAPILIPIAAIAAVFGLIGLALVKIRDAMGFTSIFDVLELGIAHLKDAFGNVVNLVGSIVNFILGMVEKFGRFLGFEIDLPEIPTMDTDNASKKKVELEEKARVAALEAERKKLSETGTGTVLLNTSAENSLGKTESVTKQTIVTSVAQNSSVATSSSVSINRSSSSRGMTEMFGHRNFR